MTTTADILHRIDDDTDEMVDLLTTLVAIPSTGGSQAEADIQALLAEWLRDNGFDVDHWRLDLDALATDPQFPGTEVDRSQAWGVVGRIPGRAGHRSLMLLGHVDVVPPGDLDAWQTAAPYAGTVIADRLYGRGACDMKAGLVAALFAARAVHRAGDLPSGDLMVACVPGEEDGGLGSFGLLRRGWRADACIITEPTGADVVPGNGGALTFRIRVPGRAAHASQRTAGISAVERFWPVFRAVRDLEADRNRRVDPLMRRWDVAYPIEIGTVSAGDWASSVPDVLVAEGRLGVALGETPQQAKDAFTDAIAAACAADDWLRDHPATIEWWGGQFASARPGPDDLALAEQVRTAHRTATGAEADLWAAPYGSDLRLLTGIGGIPTVQYGPGDPAEAHATDESVHIPQLVQVARTLAVTALGHGTAD